MTKRYRIKSVITNDGSGARTIYEYTDGDEAITEYTMTRELCNSIKLYSIRIEANAGQAEYAPMSNVTITGKILKSFINLNPTFKEVTENQHYLDLSCMTNAYPDNNYGEGDGGTTTITIRDEGYEATEINITWQGISSADLLDASTIVKG